MKRLILILGLALIVTVAQAATMQLGSTNVGASASFSVPLTINSGASALGGYALTVIFNTNVAQFVSVQGGDSEFAAGPGTINTTVPGQVRYIHQQTFSTTSPTGTIVVSRINFNAVGAPGSSSSLTISNASADDTDGLALSLPSITSGSVNILFPPQISVSPASQNFGAVTVGQTFTLPFQVANLGGQTLTGTATVGGPFSVSSGIPISVPAGLTGTVNVTFSPVAAGSFTNLVIFTSNGGAATNTVTGTGLTPGQMVVSPFNLNFGTLATGTTMQASFVVTNTGGSALSGTANIGAGAFAVVSGSPFNLAGFAGTTVAVSFTPSAAGSFNDAVVFDGTGGVSTNPVSGQGAIMPGASFSGTPTTGVVSFAVTFTDASSGTITNRSWSFGDGGTLDTAATSVMHTYSVPGSYTVRLIVSGPVGVNTNTRPNYIRALTPPQLVVTPASRDFGALTLGLTNMLSFNVINTGETNLTGSAATAAPFTIAGGSPFNVPAGGTGTVSVSFIPTSPGTANGNVVFTSNGGASTNGLVGVGLTAGQIGVSPVALHFGFAANGSFTQGVFTVTNGGGSTVSNGAATVGAPYSIVSGSPFSLPAGGSTNVVVRFSPVAVGGFTNSIIFNTANGGASTNTVTGSGAVVPIASFTGSPTNGAAPLQVTFTDTSAGTITNRFWEFGDGATTNTLATTLTHTYANVSTNTVRLIVSGPLGVHTNTLPNYIVAVNPPAMQITPASHDFGPVALGATNVLTFSVINNGDLNLTGTAATTAPFAIQAGSPFAVMPGKTGTVSVAFAPVSAGTFNGNVIFSGNAGVSTNAVTGVGAVAPGAEFNAAPTAGNAPLTVTFTDTSTGTITNRFWDFGDGATTTTVATVLTHVFEMSGTNTVQLIVAGPLGTSTKTKPDLISVTKPPHLVVTPPSIDYGAIEVNTSVQGVFTVTNTGDTPLSNGTAVVTAGPFVVVAGNTFDLAGGASINVVVSFIPTSPGTFTNAVVFNSANGGSSTNPVIGTAAAIPVADFTATPLEGLVPLTVNFTDASSGATTGRLWTFGDGATSTATNPSHQYTVPGNFTVSLQVTGPGGSDTITKPNLIRVVESNLFVRLVGSYYGLSMDDPPTFQNSGLVVMKIATSGAFSGTFQQGKTKTKFAGTFNQLGNATTTVARVGLPVMTLALHLDSSGSEQVIGEATIGGTNASLLANRDVTKTSPSPLSGRRFTALVPADIHSGGVPLGDGYAVVLIKSPGKVGLAGYTGDGQKLKQKVPISKFGTWPMYVPIYNGLGGMFGWVTHTNAVGVSDFEAPLHWHKPAVAGSAFFPAGFVDDVFMVGSLYTPPAPGQRVLTLSNGVDNAIVTIGEGNVPTPIVTVVTVTSANGVVSTNVTMKIIGPTGLFNGKFQHAGTGGTVPFKGAVLQKQNFGSGFFLGVNQTGFVNFEPTP